MLRAGRMQKGIRGLLLASLAALGVAGLATSAHAQATFITFNPTGGGLGGTTNPGPLSFVSSIDESPGNAIAVGFNPTVGSMFNLIYQADILTLPGASPSFSYASPPGGGNIPYAPIAAGAGQTTGQLTAVATFGETVTSFNPLTGTATFATNGTGMLQFYFNPTIGFSNLLGINFAPLTPGNTVLSGYTLVYQGDILSVVADPKNTGNFSASGGGVGNPLDQAPGGNFYPATSTVNGQGSSQDDALTTVANPLFFTSGAPASVALSFTNSSNNLPFTTVQPSAIFFNGTVGVASVGPVNGAGGLIPGSVTNIMFSADANTSFGPIATTPEPGTISAALTGIGFAFLAGLRAHRRRNEASAV